MPENPWTTLITITCANPALQPFWQDIQDQLRMIAARCGWDTRLVGYKLREITQTLSEIREKTPNMMLPPHKRFK
jgi:hypothetical protein